jgi:hypothetical protein
MGPSVINQFTLDKMHSMVFAMAKNTMARMAQMCSIDKWLAIINGFSRLIAYGEPAAGAEIAAEFCGEVWTGGYIVSMV